jgi:hypothetical protein
MQTLQKREFKTDFEFRYIQYCTRTLIYLQLKFYIVSVLY